jgi:LysR family transcriptional regulator, regulator for genes of the gallate degradation pathway
MRQSPIPSLALLRMFHAVARLASLTKAADLLKRSQPAVTFAISKLERQVGTVLLERGRSGARLTPDGEILARRAARMLDGLDEALREAGSVPPAGLRWSTTITDAHARCMSALADNPVIERAAEILGIFPASLRRTAQSLQRGIGRPIIQGTANGLGLSKIGAGLARRIKLALREIEDAIDEIDIAHGRARSRIAIGVVPMCASPFLSRAVNDLLSEYPEARIVIEHGSYDELLDDLRSGRIDMLYGVLRLPAWVHDAKEEPLFENPYVIAVGRDHPLTGLKRLSLEHLAQHDWIAPKPGTPRRRCLQQMFEHAACSPRIAVETSSLHVQRALLTSSDRITLLTRQEMEQEASLGFLVTLPFFPPKTRAPDGLVTRSDWQPTALQARFLELLRLHRPRSDLQKPPRSVRPSGRGGCWNSRPPADWCGDSPQQGRRYLRRSGR